jgi:XTP/dITP diphosphohydrolase
MSPLKFPLLLATANPHKVAELRAIFALVGVDVESLADLPGGRDIPEPDEIGDTFLHNATIKALAYAAATGRTSLSDDSGLTVDALAGAPGVHSSHFAAPAPTPVPASAPAPSAVSRGSDGHAAFGALPREQRDALNNARLLALLDGTPAHARAASFVCVMVLAARGVVIHHTRGEFRGRIGTPPRVPAGDHGFGYDPLFLVAPDFARTGAELDPAEKNRLSHRAQAAHTMARWLAENPGTLTPGFRRR